MVAVDPPIGHHLLADFHGVSAHILKQPALLREHLIHAARVLNVTVLGCHIHHFGDQAGVTGVLLLAESHMSIHTWPEWQFAAVDVFTCSATPPRAAIDYLAATWHPERVDVRHEPRGRGLAHAGGVVVER